MCLKNGLFWEFFRQERFKFPKKRCWSYIDTLVSGSPIIQNGYLVGAVTHVFVNDPTRGYGIYAESMLEKVNSVLDEAG